MSAADAPAEIELDPERVARWLSEDPQLQLVDVRETYEREAGHIAGSRHLPLRELAAQAESVEKDRPVVFYCRVGQRSQMAAQAFRASGFEAYTMTGGLVRWVSENHPIDPEDGHVAQH
jgi:rhodanese-related sulfurtransferase